MRAQLRYNETEAQAVVLECNGNSMEVMMDLFNGMELEGSRERGGVFARGMAASLLESERQLEIYERVERWARGYNGAEVAYLADRDLFEAVIERFGPCLRPGRAQYDLRTLYDVAFHRPSGALCVSNCGATLFCRAPRSQAPYVTRHLGMAVYLPGLGIEIANAGLVGDIHDGAVVVRSESACTPSFVFGSQRCNCAHQWDSVRELAASFNPVEPPPIPDGRGFESWVQAQFERRGRRHLPAARGGTGFVMLHVDTQNGMGSGYTPGQFCSDLYARASLRHRGEYSAEQVHSTSMAGGFRAIGIEPDPRGEDEALGYKLIPIVLDVVGISKQLIFLSNNASKIAALESAGYGVTRLRSVGEVSAAGAREAFERGSEFNHLEMDGQCVSFDCDFERVRSEIAEALSGRA